MGALNGPRFALALAALVTATPAGAQDWAPYVSEAARRFDMPERWIRQVIQAESGGRTALRGRPITSAKGAMGLMQLMPGTWRSMRTRLRLGPDPYDPRDNILAGTAYLRMMYDQFGYPGLFAAYNAGPGRYRQHLDRGRPLPAETRAYVESIVGGHDRAGQNLPGDDQSLEAAPVLIPGVGAARAALEKPGDGPLLDPLFAIRRPVQPARDDAAPDPLN
ncbi:soluble lytic murein transglycosylase-like protein [Sphingomonas zeicaulis]|uniref:lytic transglycosylase domain-containing protein n=1 Tax=Sphingomonas zeicaulis TaxID=1632740 RepID=UPI003D1E3CAA